MPLSPSLSPLVPRGETERISGGCVKMHPTANDKQNIDQRNRYENSHFTTQPTKWTKLLVRTAAHPSFLFPRSRFDYSPNGADDHPAASESVAQLGRHGRVHGQRHR